MAENDAVDVVSVDPDAAEGSRHTIQAARLLYSAPSYILRGPIYLLSIFLFVAIVFSIWARRDELVIAPLSLQRESVTIEAVGGGMVVELNTKENALIKAGESSALVQEQIRAAASPEQEAILKQIRELEDRRDDAIKDFNYKLSQHQLERRDLGKRRTTDVAALDARIQQIEFQRQTARRTKNGLVGKLNTARRQFRTKKQLYEARDITITEFEQAQERVSDLERAVNDAEAEIQKVTLSLQTARQEKKKTENLTDEKRLDALIAQTKETKQRDVAKFEERINDLQRRLQDANTLVRGVQYKGNNASYKSNFDGTVSNIHVRRGQIITPGMPIATIIKDSSALEGQVYVQNKDIGNLKYGQVVNIKYFAYPYQDFGVQNGVISDIGTRPSESEAFRSKYLVKLALDRETIKHRDGSTKQLELGLEGIAEIKTGEKRLIELVFSPVSTFFEPKKQGQAAAGGGEKTE